MIFSLNLVLLLLLNYIRQSIQQTQNTSVLLSLFCGYSIRYLLKHFLSADKYNKRISANITTFCDKFFNFTLKNTIYKKFELVQHNKRSAKKPLEFYAHKINCVKVMIMALAMVSRQLEKKT